MGSARVERRSRKRIGRRAGIIVAMFAAVVLLMGFAGMAIAETASDGGAQSAEKVSVTVKAKWADDNDADGVRPASVKVQLMADGKIAKDAKDKPIIIELAASKDWKSTVKDLDKAKDGKAIKYSLAPKDVDKYKFTVKTGSIDKDGVLGIEVTFTPEKAAQAPDEKDAADAKDDAKADEAAGKDAAADEKADGGEKDTSSASADEAKDDAKPAAVPAASGEKSDDKADDNADLKAQADDDSAAAGKPTASADDANAADDSAADDKSDAKADDNAATVTPMADEGIEVSKKWEGDEEDNRPASIEVKLLVNDEVKTTATLTAADGWEGKFDYTPDTQDTKFGVEEVEVDGYTSEVSGDVNSGFVITNTYQAAEPETIDITVTKKWDDSDDADGIRPDSVTVHLLAGGEDAGKTLELTADENWKGTFEGLAKEADGAAVEYAVEEDAVDDYTTEVSGDAESGFTITNTHEVEKKDDSKKDDGKKDDSKKDDKASAPAKAKSSTIPTISITATKVWKDKDNVKKTRADVTLFLQQKVGNGKWTTVSGSNRAIAANAAGDGLKVTWTGLPTEDKQGNKIEYRVAEQWMKNYTSKVTGDAKSGFTVTNTLGRIPKTGDANAGGATVAIVLVIAAARVFAATRRTRRE